MGAQKSCSLLDSTSKRGCGCWILYSKMRVVRFSSLWQDIIAGTASSSFAVITAVSTTPDEF
jgi:hypothetical protein